jgi:hypothetical protein
VSLLPRDSRVVSPPTVEAPLAGTGGAVTTSDAPAALGRDCVRIVRGAALLLR